MLTHGQPTHGQHLAAVGLARTANTHGQMLTQQYGLGESVCSIRYVESSRPVFVRITMWSAYTLAYVSVLYDLDPFLTRKLRLHVKHIEDFLADAHELITPGGLQECERWVQELTFVREG